MYPLFLNQIESLSLSQNNYKKILRQNMTSWVRECRVTIIGPFTLEVLESELNLRQNRNGMLSPIYITGRKYMSTHFSTNFIGRE